MTNSMRSGKRMSRLSDPIVDHQRLPDRSGGRFSILSLRSRNRNGPSAGAATEAVSGGVSKWGCDTLDQPASP